MEVWKRNAIATGQDHFAMAKGFRCRTCYDEKYVYPRTTRHGPTDCANWYDFCRCDPQLCPNCTPKDGSGGSP